MVYDGAEYVSGKGGIGMKRIMVEPAQEIELIDPIEDKKYHGFCNMRSLLEFQKIMNKLEINLDSLEDSNILPCCVYAIFMPESGISYEEAERISNKISMLSGREVVETFMESLYTMMDDKQKEIAKKVMARYVTMKQRKG